MAIRNHRSRNDIYKYSISDSSHEVKDFFTNMGSLARIYNEMIEEELAGNFILRPTGRLSSGVIDVIPNNHFFQIRSVKVVLIAVLYTPVFVKG